jgi:hypothetical protein
VQAKIIKTLTAKYCVSTSKQATAECFTNDTLAWIFGKQTGRWYGKSAPPVVRVFANYFNMGLRELLQRINQPGLDRRQIVEKMGEEYAEIIMPKLMDALSTPVQVMLPKYLMSSAEARSSGRKLRSAADVYDAPPFGHFIKSKIIGVRADLETWLSSRYGTSGFLEVYITYGLGHEYRHAIDRELRISGGSSFLSRVKAATGRAKLGYYGQKDEYAAEFYNVIDKLKRVPDRNDINELCRFYEKYGDRIHTRIKAKKLAGFDITDMDLLIQSPWLRGMVDCSDRKGTVARFDALSLKYKSKQMAERKRRK